MKYFCVSVVLSAVFGTAFGAASVRTTQRGPEVVANLPTVRRAGTLQTVQKSVNNGATNVARTPTVLGGGTKPGTTAIGAGGAISGGQKISNKNMGTVLLDNLQQQIDVLREYYESLPTRDEVVALETELQTHYAKKDDFNSLQFAVRDENVTYSIDDGKTWNTVAPVSTFAGQDGCTPTIVSTEDNANKRIILGINNCNDYTEVTYIPFGKDGAAGKEGAPGKDGADGKDACTPHFTSAKADGVTTVTYTCGDASNTFAISDGKDAELTLQDITRFKLLTEDNVADNTIIKNISSKIQTIETNTEELESIKKALRAVSNNWQDIDETISVLNED